MLPFTARLFYLPPSPGCDLDQGRGWEVHTLQYIKEGEERYVRTSSTGLGDFPRDWLGFIDVGRALMASSARRTVEHYLTPYLLNMD